MNDGAIQIFIQNNSRAALLSAAPRRGVRRGAARCAAILLPEIDIFIRRFSSAFY